MFCSVLQCGREVTSRPPWGLLAAAHWRSPEWLLLPGSGGRCPAAAGGHLSPPGMANLHAPHGRPPGVASTFVPGAPHSVSDAGASLSPSSLPPRSARESLPLEVSQALVGREAGCPPHSARPPAARRGEPLRSPLRGGGARLLCDPQNHFPTSLPGTAGTPPNTHACPGDRCVPADSCVRGDRCHVPGDSCVPG